MLTARQAFKVGFLRKCAELGMSDEETEATIKSAILGLDAVINAVGTAGSKALQIGTPLALAAPPLAGAALGYGLSRATDVDDTDVAELRQRELVDEYRRLTARLRQRREMLKRVTG